MDSEVLGRRSARRMRVWLLAAAVLIAPAVVSIPTGLREWHLELGLVGLVALCAAGEEPLRLHRQVASPHGWLDVLSGTLGTSALLITFAGAPLARASGESLLMAALTLCCLGALIIQSATTAAVAVLVGPRTDRRAAALAVAAVVVLAAGCGYVADQARLVNVPPSLITGVAVTGCLLLLAALLLPCPPAAVRRRIGVLPQAVGGFAVIAQGMVVLLVVPSGWDARGIVALAVGAVVSAGLRLVLLLRGISALHDARALAVTDEVTGLVNRRAMLAEVTALAGHPGAALVVLDVDRLHVVTDVWGREVGDAVLREVGDRIRSAVGASATRTARIDGGAFAVLLPSGGGAAALASAVAIAEQLTEPFALPQGSARLRVAVGVALLDATAPGAGRDPAVDALRRAEAAATHSRSSDGAPVLHDAALDEAAAARADLAAALTTAIATERLALHYQPQLLVGGEAVQGAEALVRWVDPEHGSVPPDVFVPLAEELGLQGRLTRWVVGEALREAARWREAGCAVPVSVNLSPSDLRPELVDDVARALTAAGVPGSALVLEITETGIVSDPVGAAAVLTALVDLGVEISIDDYGTGYSSLSLLMALPVTELKIDRVFVRDLENDARSAVVVRTTVDLAHSLGLRVVAEGVETPEVLARLAELGCDVSQGYLHSRPLPAEEVRGWLASAVGRCAALRPQLGPQLGPQRRAVLPAVGTRP